MTFFKFDRNLKLNLLHVLYYFHLPFIFSHKRVLPFTHHASAVSPAKWKKLSQLQQYFLHSNQALVQSCFKAPLSSLHAPLWTPSGTPPLDPSAARHKQTAADSECWDEDAGLPNAEMQMWMAAGSDGGGGRWWWLGWGGARG